MMCYEHVAGASSTLSALQPKNPPIESFSVGKPPLSRKGRGHFPRRRPKGFENRVLMAHAPMLAGTYVHLSVVTPITDPSSIDILIQAARKALAASVLDSEKALLEPSHPC